MKATVTINSRGVMTLPAKLRRAAEYFAGDWRRVSTHTNFEMAARSLTGCVQHLDEILAAVPRGAPARPGEPEKDES